jgi:leader peptidase (prepilin peptidase)/N-methyltransferase
MLPPVSALLFAPFAGSFLATVAVRLPEGRSIARGRSRCPACDRALGIVDLVPIVSWLALRGRCRHCGAAIAPFYPLFELACLAIAAWAALVVSGWAIWPTAVLGWLLLTLAEVDRRCMVLPDALTLPLLIIGLVAVAVLAPQRLPAHAAGAAAGFAVFALITVAYRRLRGREGLGLGDAKLLAAGGAWVGWQGLPSIIGGAAALALVVVLTTRWAARWSGPRDRGAAWLAAEQRIAFGPFLAAAIWLVWLYGPLAIPAGGA